MTSESNESLDSNLPTHGNSASTAKSIVVYTAITGSYDVLRPQPAASCHDAEFVAFVEQDVRCPPWQLRSLDRIGADPCRCAKFYKVMPHLFFPEMRYSLWIDGSISLKVSPKYLIEEYLRDFDMVVHRHSKRKCVYAEAIVCKRLGRDEPTRISDQMSRYRSQGYPANAGLHENGIVLRKHNERVRAFNETWWNEIKRGSRRDQLSSTYAAREASLMVAYFPGTLYPAHRATSKLFTLHPHNRSRPSNGAK